MPPPPKVIRSGVRVMINVFSSGFVRLVWSLAKIGRHVFTKLESQLTYYSLRRFHFKQIRVQANHHKRNSHLCIHSSDRKAKSTIGMFRFCLIFYFFQSGILGEQLAKHGPILFITSRDIEVRFNLLRNLVDDDRGNKMNTVPIRWY